MMRSLFFLTLLAVVPVVAQRPETAPAQPESGAREAAAPSSNVAQAPEPAGEKELSPQQAEEAAFNKLMAEAGTSPIDYARALEEHLRRFPDTPRRAVIERSLAQAAMDAKDSRRIILYGERVLKREPTNLKILERLIRALLEDDDPGNAKKALLFARQYESGLKLLEFSQAPVGPAIARMRQQLDAAMGKALVYQARASGNLGHMEEAVELARRSYETNPTAEAARETGRWLARLNRTEEAIRRIGDAFVISDASNSPALRAGDRARLRELYLKTHDSEAGLGDLILEAYDRTSDALKRKQEALKKLAPNLDVTDPTEMVLPALNGEKLALSSLRGKVTVLDFWATWCKPCRVQQPLYDDVKKNYRDNPDVVFLSINTDEDRVIVKPFVEHNQWDKTVYFEDGLQRLLKISSIPTTIILDQRGEVASRMMGFIPERFVDMLAERIERTLAGK